MITAGVDLASRERNSALCVIDWTNSPACVTRLVTGVSDADIREVAEQSVKLGVDVPFGWPIGFADAIALHNHTGRWPPGYLHESNEAFRLRRTDLFVRQQVNLHPLSVSTDRIAIPAMRFAALIDGFAGDIALDGSGALIEVYPAAALVRWGLPHRGYKGAGRLERRNALIEEFLGMSRTWLRVDEEDVVLCRRNDDAFDSLVAALVARAAVIGEVEVIPAADQGAARREGWIALPKEQSLSRLASI